MERFKYSDKGKWIKKPCQELNFNTFSILYTPHRQGVGAGGGVVGDAVS